MSSQCSVNTHIVWSKQLAPWKVLAVLAIIVVVGVLKNILVHLVCNLKATQMNRQHNLIWALKLYEFKLGHNAMEIFKIFFHVRGEGAVDHTKVTRHFMSCKIFKESSTESIRQAWNLTVQSGFVTFMALAKNIQSFWIVPHITKLLQKF